MELNRTADRCRTPVTGQYRFIEASKNIRPRTGLHFGSLGALVACAAGLVLLLTCPAKAQTIICDTDFSPSNWQLQTFSCPAGNSVTTTQQQTAGSISTSLPNPQPPAACPLNGRYRDVTDNVSQPGNGIGGSCPGESTVFGVHIFNAPNGSYNPVTSGAIASINFQVDFQCPDSAMTSNTECSLAGEAFGPALVQGGRYFVANTVGTTTGVTGTPPLWKRFSAGTLQASAFHEITVTGSGASQLININPTSNPDFKATAAPIQCGFYTGNASALATYSEQAGYDNWSCTIVPVGVLKVCKVAGPGITVGTPFSFTANGNPFQVPAGPGPGGTCVVVNAGAGFPVGSTVNIVETPIPAGVAVSTITVAVAPPGSAVTNNATGTATVITGSGVTEVTYTDYMTTGFLEICKTGVTGGSFMVNPGNVGPFAVPAGACSPAIQVTAGQVMITETPNSAGTFINSCTTFPSGRLVSCPPTTPNIVVNVLPGGIPAETIVTVNNAINHPASPAR